MWTATAMGREANCSYNQCFAFELRGPLRVESLRAALDRSSPPRGPARRDRAGRRRARRCGRPSPSSCRCIDVSDLDPDERERELERLARPGVRDAVRPRRRTAASARSSCARPRMRHRFVLTVHHIVCDGWSSSVLFSDLGPLYAADCVGIPAQLGSAASYRELRRRADEPRRTRRRGGGRGVLGRAVSTTERRSSTCPLRCAACPQDLSQRPRGVADRRRALRGSQADRGTLGSHALRHARSRRTRSLLSRLSGQTDLVVGIPFAGQPRLENPDARRALRQHGSAASARRPGRPLRRPPPHRRATTSPRPRTTRASPSAVSCAGCSSRATRAARHSSRRRSRSTRSGRRSTSATSSIASVRTPRSFSNFEIQVNVGRQRLGSPARVRLQRRSLLRSRRSAAGSRTTRPCSAAIVARSGRAGRAPFRSSRGGARVAAGRSGGRLRQVRACLHGRFEEQVTSDPRRGGRRLW